MECGCATARTRTRTRTKNQKKIKLSKKEKKKQANKEFGLSFFVYIRLIFQYFYEYLRMELFN